MSLRPRCGAAPRYMDCKSVTSRNGKGRRCGCENVREQSLRRLSLLCECVLLDAEECEVRVESVHSSVRSTRCVLKT